MNKEDFVDYSQALALEGLGFDLDTDYVYISINSKISRVTRSEFIGNGLNKICDSSCPSPTLLEAHKFLISKGLLIVPYSMSFESWKYRLCKRGEQFVDSKLYEDFYSYEEALSDGITKCIKILEK